MLAIAARGFIMFVALLILASASANTLQGQRIAPVGAHAASIGAATQASDMETRSLVFSDATRVAAGTGHSRAFHVLIGLLGGGAIGAARGAIVANHNAKQCHAESCQVEAALGGLDIIADGLVGAAVGAGVGLLWPVNR